MLKPPFPAGPAPRSIALVGNAPDPRDISAQINAADWVVRFNAPHGFGAQTGTRVDDLFLVNCGGQALEWLQDDGFWENPSLRRTGLVTLPWAAPARREALSAAFEASGSALDGCNFEWDMRAKLAATGTPVRTLTQSDVQRAREALGSAAPASTGFLALVHYWTWAEQHPGTTLDLYGFGFDGWEEHDWGAEQRWVMARAHEGGLRFHPVALG